MTRHAAACATAFLLHLFLPSPATPTPRLAPPEPEMQVNSYTTGDQRSPGIAVHDSGFVVVWQSDGSPGDDSAGRSIQARRYGLDGTALADQLQVNSSTVGNQDLPAVAAWPDGRFVVAWRNGSGQRGRVFDSAGTAIGADFEVTGAAGGTPALTTAGADFVATWGQGTAGGDTEGIVRRRFDSVGTPLGEDQLVNVSTADGQSRPDIRAAPDGTFLVTWQDNLGGGGSRILGRRLDAASDPIGGELEISSFTTAGQIFPFLDVAADGTALVSWQSGTGPSDPDGTAALARRLDSGGQPVGDDFQVNAFTTSYQYPTDVAALPGGDFLVLWSGSAASSGDADDSAQVATRIDSDGMPVGAEFAVNSLVVGYQYDGRAAVTATGDVLVVWTSESSGGTDGDQSVQARFYQSEADVGTDLEGPTAGEVGDEVVYLLTATNAGPDAATAALLGLDLPSDLDCAWTSEASGNVTGHSAAGAGDVAETLFLPRSSEVVYTIACEILPSASGVYPLEASIAADQVDAVAANDTAGIELEIGFFVDGFESGDTSAWSVSR